MLIRSIIFYFLLYFWTLILGIVCLPYLLLPNSYMRSVANLWIDGILTLLKFTCGITYEIRNKEIELKSLKNENENMKIRHEKSLKASNESYFTSLNTLKKKHYF